MCARERRPRAPTLLHSLSIYLSLSPSHLGAHVAQHKPHIGAAAESEQYVVLLPAETELSAAQSALAWPPKHEELRDLKL